MTTNLCLYRYGKLISYIALSLTNHSYQEGIENLGDSKIKFVIEISASISVLSIMELLKELLWTQIFYSPVVNDILRTYVNIAELKFNLNVASLLMALVFLQLQLY